MNSKLTLKLDKFVIEKAKRYASSHNRSLSGLIESYLKNLTTDDMESKKNDIEITPFVKSMSTGVKIPADLDYKKEYSDFITNKYK